MVQDAPRHLRRSVRRVRGALRTGRAGLDAVGIPYVEAPQLVRGLDYYRRTTFEFAAEALDAAQNAIGGGGRYDGLAEDLGGPPTDGIGFASRRRPDPAGL